MIDCAYCERPLICESCRTPYTPPSQQDYEALSQPDVALGCPECGTVLVCHWCKTP
jgi:RNase P subunit RPR2